MLITALKKDNFYVIIFTMYKIYFKDIRKNRVERINSIKDGCWINIENANQKDLDYIKKVAKLSKEDIEDISDPLELPRIERQGKTIIVFIRSVGEGENYTEPLTIIVTAKYFITISLNRNSVIESILKEKNFSFPTTQRSKFLIYILLAISKSYTKKVKLIKQSVVSQKKKLKDVESLDIVKLIESEEILNNYISALIPMKNVFETIANGEYVPVYAHDNDLVQDMIINIRQSVDVCSVNIKSIRNLKESYQILFTNKLNRSIRLLTSLTVILTIPTIVASIFGMNVGLPMESNPLAFLYIILISMVVSFILFIIFYINKWF